MDLYNNISIIKHKSYSLLYLFSNSICKLVSYIFINKNKAYKHMNVCNRSYRVFETLKCTAIFFYSLHIYLLKCCKRVLSYSHINKFNVLEIIYKYSLWKKMGGFDKWTFFKYFCKKLTWRALCSALMSKLFD